MKNIMKLPFLILLSNYRKYKSDVVTKVKTEDIEENMFETLYVTRVYGFNEVELRIENEVS